MIRHTLPSSLVLVLAISLLATPIFAAYSLLDNFAGSDFLSGFNFFTDSDPTHGFVKFLNQADAQSQGLISTTGSQFQMGVDSKNKAPNGRASVRLHSKKMYKFGLFVLDIAHMPAGVCGTWPSFWTWGSEATWPSLGEIDIIEGIHTQTVNAMSLHTSDGCSTNATNMLGKLVTKNCFIGAPGQTSNAGCGIESSLATSFGTPFNAGGGGVFAMEWTSSFIKMWYFPRNAIPANLGGSAPNTDTWGQPDANFAGDCDFGKHFGDQRVVLDTTFCGDWAGALWGSNPTCNALGVSCIDYVANNPTAFADSYWKINSLKIYQH